MPPLARDSSLSNSVHVSAMRYRLSAHENPLPRMGLQAMVLVPWLFENLLLIVYMELALEVAFRAVSFTSSTFMYLQSLLETSPGI